MKISVEKENIFHVNRSYFGDLECLTGGLIKNGIMTVDKIDFYYDENQLEYDSDFMVYFINGNKLSAHRDGVLGILQPVLLNRHPRI